jgi:hypothetical protein
MNQPAAEGTPRVPPTSADAIDAEIADHLASTAERLAAHGAPPEAARQAAHQHFGDVPSIRRRCYWIREGESLMFRTAVLVLLVGLSLGLTVTAIGTWQTQSCLAEQVTALTEQLKLLAENQRAAAPPPAAEPKPLEIVGRVFARSPDQPVAGKEVLIVSVKDGNIIRRVLSDAQGNYRSGPLADGDYALVATLESKSPPYHPYVQSQPIYVYPGVGATNFDFDVAYHAGRVRLTTSRPLPRREVAGKYTIDSRLMVKVTVPRMHTYLWTSNLKIPERWPLHTRIISAFPGPGRGGYPMSREGAVEFVELLSSSDLDSDWSQTRFTDSIGLVPPGDVEIHVALLVDVLPVADQHTITLRNGRFGPSGVISPSDRSGTARKVLQTWERITTQPPLSSSGQHLPRSLDKPTWSTADDDFFWLTKGLGKRWLEHLQRKPDEEALPAPFLVSSSWLGIGAEARPVPVTDGQETRVRVEIPDDVEDKLQQFVESVTDPEAFAKRTLGESDILVGNFRSNQEQPSVELQSGTSPFFRQVTLTVQGMQPVAEK